jgi:hypothetical protein
LSAFAEALLFHRRRKGDGLMPADVRAISLHLIDPSDGRSLQTWSFSAERITIGRDEAAGIPLADPYVSRIHAELVHADGGWSLFARGRNGVFVDGRSIAEHRLEDGTTFRLAAVGPMFRFDNGSESMGQATLSYDPDAVILLTLNSKEVAQQANEIASTDYFQQLREKARELRRQRTGSA